MANICDFCGGDFSNKYNLSRHQKNTCGGVPDEKYKCKYCNNNFGNKSNLQRHKVICSLKNEYILKRRNKELKITHKKEISILEWNLGEKDDKILKLKRIIKERDEELKEKDENIKEKDEEIINLKIKCETGKIEVYDKVCNKVLDKSTVTNNTSVYAHPKLANLPITNIHPLTIEYIKDKVADGGYTMDHYLRGENGLADFIYSLTTYENADGIMELNYACTDLTRDSYHRLIETKEWKKDKGGKYMDIIFDSIKDQVNEYHMDMYAKRTDKNFKPSLGFNPDYIFKLNTDMHAGIVQTRGKERRALVQRIKKETSRKIFV